jgi:hypothetical protein
MNRFVMVGLIAAVTTAVAMPAQAIVYGSPDGSGHPEVGLTLAQQQHSNGTWGDCSGTLISPTVFLTAEHCDPSPKPVTVTFDTDYQAGGKAYAGVWHADPAFTHANNDPHDMAVIVFKKPIRGLTPAQLPAANSLDNLAPSQQFTYVGYGAQSVTHKGGPDFQYQDTRYVATGGLNSVTPAWLHTSQNPAHGDGGPCDGDSGGPNFLGAGANETRVVAAINNTGDSWCQATNMALRLDTPSARAFLKDYVTLP